MSSRRELSLELEEQQAAGRGGGGGSPFITYMTSGERMHQQEQHAQQLRGYDASGCGSPSRVLEGGFFPWGSSASSASRGPFTGVLPSYLQHQRELRHQQQQEHQLMRQTSSAGREEQNMMEMALNVRGMNVIPLAQRSPSALVLEQQQQQQQQHQQEHHQQQLQITPLQFHQLQQQQQQQFLQQQPRPPSAAILPRAGSSTAYLHQIQQHDSSIPIQQQQHHQQQHHQQQQQQMQLVTSSSSTASGGSTCKECGNQAKKDCVYQRCRTCCKSRGFECATHVRSTWVPAAKRRERQVAEAAAIASGQPRPKSKRNRAIAMQQQEQQLNQQQQQQQQGASADQLQPPPHLMVMDEDITAVTPTTTTTSNSPHSDARQSQPADIGTLPSEVRAQAVFKCVKVTRVDNGEDEYAYQAVVRIGGRVFKGVLQDHGSDSGAGGGSISGETTSLGELQLGATPAVGTGGAGGATGTTETQPPQLLHLDPTGAAAVTTGLFGSPSGGPSL